MPEQDKKIKSDHIISSGFFVFSAICVLLSSAFRGNFPSLIPTFLIFIFSLTLGSFLGSRTDSLWVRYFEFLFGFTALFFFRSAECFALISGFLAGYISAEAFEREAVPEHKKTYYRHFWNYGIFAIFLSYWIGFLSIPIAAAV